YGWRPAVGSGGPGGRASDRVADLGGLRDGRRRHGRADQHAPDMRAGPGRRQYRQWYRRRRDGRTNRCASGNGEEEPRTENLEPNSLRWVLGSWFRIIGGDNAHT